jgi:hypothetical protein
MKLTLWALMACMTLEIASAVVEHDFTVLKRKTRSNKSYYTKVIIEDLESDNSFDGKYFKIVKGKSNEAVSFDDPDQDLVLKAANTYYHLTKAKNFWVYKLFSELPDKLPKIIVRLKITNLFDEQGHFANDNRNPQFNNALAIPEGKSPSWIPASNQKSWNKEIWFRPMKKISTADMKNNLGPNPVTVALKTIESPFINYTQSRFNMTLLEHMLYPNYVARPFWQDSLIFAGTIAMTKVVIEASKRMDRLFMEKWFYLDTAMVPEVIYHEYAHIILSDHLEISHSTPVVEGMADYFAAVLSGKRKVYARVPNFSNSNPKNTQHKRPYGHWVESNHAAAGDFVLAVLWDVRETLGAEMGDKLVYEARKLLSTKSATIADHMLRSILETCESVCKNPRADKYKLYEAFSKRGF